MTEYVKMAIPTPWYRQGGCTLETFVLGMLTMGKPVETLIVGAFNDAGRGAQRDMELPFHRDGERSAALASLQGGEYVEHPKVDIVGFYCLRSNLKTVTTLLNEETGKTGSFTLLKGEFLVFDNRLVLHRREGPVGDRILFRMWLELPR